ncbi:Na+/H+ antiporter NhaA [Streptomyces sp. NRRL F-5123]|uniref:Na+/H+ antiporter NhaA n=1 Tax=Streptomyces sp. NRRL F-5123 TaxID=1463856 RepID=UPI0004E0D519|nr:Na+/H+ antiporter NhaA [Streptomyces sp. NRRL F-5123]
MPEPRRRRPAVLLGRLPLPERNALLDALRAETVGGLLLLAAAAAALIWANTAQRGYGTVVHHHVGPAALGLHLSVAHWASDGLLAVFFFVAGIELKRELVTGELRTPSAAALPVVAALCGMAVPAGVYAVTAAAGGGSLRGWAVPTATDIAFALGVLAVIGTALPAALRAFLLTLAVVDDLCAILVIAIFFTSTVNVAALVGAAACLVLFWLLLHARVRGWYVYVPLALVTWALTVNSGIHATVAGVALGLMLRCTPRPRPEGTGTTAEVAGPSQAEHVEHLLRPLSAGLAVPLFALFNAGVAVSGTALSGVFTRPETLGVVLGLVAGKTAGIFGGTWAAARFTRASLNPDLAWPDVFAMAALGGIGFTVALLIGELAFASDPALTAETKAAVLVGSVVSALLASVLLKLRDTTYRRLSEDEERDEDGDGVPDVYEEDDPAYHLRMAEILEAKAAEHRRLAQLARRDSGPDTI